MKKTRFIALFITAAMITTSAVSIPAYAQGTATPDSAVGNTTGEWENKLGDPIYAEILNNADENEKFMTIVGIPDMADHKAIEQEAQSITGINEENYDTISESEYNEELAKWSSEDEELLKNASNPEDMKKSIIDGRVRENKANRFARIVNQLTADVYTEENAKILAKLGVAEEDIVDYGTDLPEPILMLTKSEIERIAEFDDVKCIDLDIFHDVPQIEEVVEWEDKLGDPIYVEFLNNADENEKFMTIIRIPDMADHEAIEKEAQRITGINEENYDTISESEYSEELAKWSAEDEELLKNTSNPEDMKKAIIERRVRENKANRYARTVTQLLADVYTEENAKILAKLGVAEEDVIDVGTDTPTLILNLTKSEIERIAAFDDVTCIDLDIFRDVPVDENPKEDSHGTSTNDDTDIPPIDLIVTPEKADFPNNNESVTFNVAGEPGKLLTVDLNREKVDPENYTFAQTQDSASITFKPEFLRELPNGVYKMTAYFISGLAHAEITIGDTRRNLSETTVFLNDVEDTSKYGGLGITEIAMTYTGSPVTLNIVVKDGDKTLEENVDYTAEYSNNIETGTAYLDIIGIGSYKGTRSYHFEIMKADMFGKQGDADGDGEITSNDALILLRGSIDNKKFSESEMALCDMDKDRIITSNDALIVLRKSVGYSE